MRLPSPRLLEPGFRLGASFEARFSDDGSKLVTLGKRPTVWDVATRRKLGTTPQLAHASHADFSPDGKRLAIKSTAGIVMVVDVASLEEVAPRFGGNYGEGSDIRFSPCGEFLIDGSWSGHLLVRSADTGEVAWTEYQADGMVNRLQTVGNRSLCLYERAARYPGPHRHFLREWPFSDGEATELIGLERGGMATLTEDGQRLALQGPKLDVYDVSDPGRCRLLASAPGVHDALAWSPSGDFLAAAGDGAGAIFSSELELVHREQLEYPSDADWSPAGDLIAFGAWSQGIVLAWPQALVQS